MLNINEELSDIAEHCHRSDININIAKLYTLFYENHKAIFGSFKYEKDPHYTSHMNNRYRYITDNIWDVIEGKISGQTIKEPGLYHLGRLQK